MSPLPQPQDYVCKLPATVEAMRWQPGELAAAGMLVGWLLRSGAVFNHPSGMGETTTLQIEGQPLALPGDWIVWDGERFRPFASDVFGRVYEAVPDAG